MLKMESFDSFIVLKIMLLAFKITKQFLNKPKCNLGDLRRSSKKWNRTDTIIKLPSKLGCLKKLLIEHTQGITGLDCWFAQSGLQSNLVDWIVIDNPKSKLDFGFGLSIHFCHFNPNPKYHNYLSWY
jgi:hypothetical protein